MAAEDKAGPPRGRDATKPSQIPARGWWDILNRVRDRIGRDRIATIAAGTAFFVLLAIFPALAALVSLYGLVADPAAITQHIDAIAAILPDEAVSIIREQIQRLVEQSDGSLSFGLLVGLLISLWSANNGVKNVRVAMNVAYGEYEKRSFLSLTLTTLAVTICGLLLFALIVLALGLLPGILATLGIGEIAERLIIWLRWPFLLVIVILALALIYRYAPSRTPAKWRWITWGSVMAGLVWVSGSLLFSWYLSNFANYGATYGALGATIGFLIWAWLSMFVVLLGAEIDAEIEHQTEADSTVGADKPMGERGAVMADTVGPTSEELAERRSPSAG